MKTAPIPPTAGRPVSPRSSRWFAAVLAAFACVASANAAVVSDSFTLFNGTLLHGTVVNGTPAWTAGTHVVLADGVVTTDANGHAEFKLPVPNKSAGRLVLKADLRVGEGTAWAGLFLGAEQGSTYSDPNNPLLVILYGSGHVGLFKNGASSSLISPRSVAGFGRSQFHTLELHYDADAGEADVFVDGSKINTSSITVGPLNNSRVNTAGIRFFGNDTVGGSPAADNFSYSADGREFSDAFASPDGPLNGVALIGTPSWTADARVVLANGVVTTNSNGSAEFKLPVPNKDAGRLVLKADLRVGEGADWAGLFLGAEQGSAFDNANNPLLVTLRGTGYVQLYKNGTSALLYSSPQVVAGFNRSKFHTLELHYDADAGKADVFVDGNKINTSSISVGLLNNPRINSAGLRFNGAAVGGSPAADSFFYSADGREFFDAFASPDGPLNGIVLNGAPAWRVKAGTPLAPLASLVAASGTVTTDINGSAQLTLPVPKKIGGRLVLKADLRVGDGADWAGLFFGAEAESDYNDTNNPLTAILRGTGSTGYVQLLKNGVLTNFYTSAGIPNFDRNAFYTLELHHDREGGTADVFLNGVRLNPNPLAVTGLNQETVGAIGVRFQGAQSGKPAVDNITYTVSGREAVICYLSWHSPIGKLNGTTQWGFKGYRNQLAEESGGIMNYPLPLPIDDFPTQAPLVGSTEFYRLQREAAAITQHQMIEAGFDVMLFDMLPMPEYDPESLLTEFNSPLAHFKTFLVWLDEAEQSGIKVGLMPDVANQSGDYPVRRNPTVSEWTRILAGALDQAPDSSALWKIGDRPVLAHFGTDITYSPAVAPNPDASTPEGGWAEILNNLRDAGKQFHFIADIRPHAQVAAWNGIADSAWLFTPSAPAGALPDMQRVIADRHLSIPLMWTVSPGYYRGGSAYSQPGFARIHDTYLAAMRSGASRICVLTWNDFEEDTDIVPSVNKGHALLDVFAYYNEWFKTGSQPLPTEDLVVLAYPRRIPSQIVTNAPAYGRLGNNLASIPGGWPSPAYQPKVFYWAYVKAAGTLAVEGVGEVNFPRPGLWHGELGVAASGAVQATFQGSAVTLPSIVATTLEKARSDEGGLEYRYVNLTAQP